MYGSNDGRGGGRWEGRDFKLKLLFYPSNIKIVSRFLNYSLHKKLNMKTQ